MKKDSEQDWLEKCLKCQHSYHKNDDADTIYCRCRNGQCNYKERIDNKSEDMR